MSRRGMGIFRKAFAGLALVVVGVSCPNAQAAEWRALFNGRDIEGWQVVDGRPGDWTVTDGLLHPARAGGWLSTTEEFGDFELVVEYQLEPGSNSGIFFRAPHEGRISRTGNEIQLIDDFTKVYGPLETWQLTGGLYHVAAPQPGACLPAGQWQTITLRAAGPELRIELNGKVVLETRMDGFASLEAEHPGLRRPRGYLGLQNYGGRMIRFREIRLREVK